MHALNVQNFNMASSLLNCYFLLQKGTETAVTQWNNISVTPLDLN